MNGSLPLKCPSCAAQLSVTRLHCTNCKTEVSGIYDLPAFSKLTQEDQAFIIDFVIASGSLKVMAEKMKLSYPTVRNRLDDIIDKLKPV